MTRNFRSTLIFAVILPILAVDQPCEAQESTFQATLRQGGEVIDLTGEAPLILFPSMFSVYLEDEEGRCAVHLTGFKAIPTGTFSVEAGDSLKVRTLCVLNNVTPRERLLAETGTLRIKEYTEGRLTGTFDMCLRGGITGSEYRFTGQFSAFPPKDF